MFFPFRQEGNVKESMLSSSAATVLDPGNNTRPFSSPFVTAQSQGGNPGGFHHGGALQSLHNVPGAYNLQNMQTALSSRNAQTSAAQHPSGSIATGRFSTSNVQGGLPQQMSHTGLHGHSSMATRGGLGVNHQFGSNMNGIAPGPGNATTGATGSATNPRGALGSGGMAVNPSIGSSGARLGTPGVGMAGAGSVQNMGSSGAVGTLNRSLNTGATLNMAALNGSRGMANVALGPLGSTGPLVAQGPGRPGSGGGNLLQQQGVNMPSAAYSSSSDILAMISRGQSGGVMLGNNYSAAPGGSIQGQPQNANGQIGSLGLNNTETNAGEGLAFDINEFPSLTTRPNSASGALGPTGLRKNAGVSAIVQQNTEFSIQNEDFPALPGFKAGGGPELGEMQKDQQQDGGISVLQSQHFSGHLGGQQSNEQSVMAGLRNLASTGSSGGLTQYEQLVSQHQFQQSQAQQQLQHRQAQVRLGAHQQQQMGATSHLAGKEGGLRPGQMLQQSSHDQFGLLGLLSVIRMSDADLTTLALGTDLTTLGLNLNSRENLYKTFASPWAEGPMRGEPEFTLPSCYVQPAPSLQPGYFCKFQRDTLFYIFYSMPNDEAQIYAAEELHNRGWFYHKEHQLWFTTVTNTEPLVKTQNYERGSYYFFDPTVWEVGRKDNFVLQYEMLEKRPAPVLPQR